MFDQLESLFSIAHQISARVSTLLMIVDDVIAFLSFVVTFHDCPAFSLGHSTSHLSCIIMLHGILFQYDSSSFHHISSYFIPLLPFHHAISS